MHPEDLLQPFRARPGLAVDVLRDIFHEPVHSDIDARSSLREMMHDWMNRRKDRLLILAGEPPVLAVVVEAVLQENPEEHYEWPLFMAQARARYRCPTWLIVVTTLPEIASWCAAPIALGHPGYTLSPLVLGPETIPVVTDPDKARAMPEMCVLSAMAHGRSEAGEAIMRAFLMVAPQIEESLRLVYADLALFSLDKAIQQKLESLGLLDELGRCYMRRRYQVATRAAAVIAILEARGLQIPPEVRRRLHASNDLNTLKDCILRAAVVKDARNVFLFPDP